ncbi:hypothetical protein P4B35_20460 [Pontiellaceae bacterium B12227]|nr:hypothetical protein [Pontiellaceae bacterium B12227]
MNAPVDPNSQTFGMPPCLRVPIAAANLDAIETYVGTVRRTVAGRDGQTKALLIEPHRIGEPEKPEALLWEHADRESYIDRLYPALQVWVHVNYRRYRKAYLDFGMPIPSAGPILDHIQNREAIRLRNLSHPYIRLCPVSRRVNSSGGHATGTEGMEKENLRADLASPQKAEEKRKFFASFKIVYADPIDLTKMLNIPTGTKELPGVATMLRMFYLPGSF